MRRAALVILVMGQLTCHQVILTAPEGSSIFLFANPGFVPAHGGVSVISALVVEEIGTPVADGTVVQFFTTLGRIEEQGKTNDGVARVNFVSDARSGTARISAFSGNITSAEPVEVGVGSILPVRVLVTASPQRLTDSRTSRIVATVLDDNGNPVPSVPVFFSVDGPTESMESGGRAVFTDNDGRAVDVMRTRYPRDAVPAITVTVTATTGSGATGASGSTMVTIN